MIRLSPTSKLLPSIYSLRSLEPGFRRTAKGSCGPWKKKASQSVCCKEHQKLFKHWAWHPSLQVPRHVVSSQKARHLFKIVQRSSKYLPRPNLGIPLFLLETLQFQLGLCQLLIGHGCPVSTLQNSEET